jgi:hypothetical protein
LIGTKLELGSRITKNQAPRKAGAERRASPYATGASRVARAKVGRSHSLGLRAMGQP